MAQAILKGHATIYGPSMDSPSPSPSPCLSCIFTGARANECVCERYVVQADLRLIKRKGFRVRERVRRKEGSTGNSMARKEWYLYVQSTERLLRLNLSDLCGESGSSSRPDLEVAHDYSDGRVPIGMGCMVVGSKIYMVGGENTKEGSMLLDRDEKNWLNSDNVYAFDPTKMEDRLVLVRDGAVPSLKAPKTCPLVVTLEGKFYLQSRKPCLGCLTGDFDFDPLDIEHHPIFEGFDPTLPIPSWKILPDYPPYTKSYPISADDYFAWGHKLVLGPPDYFIFDAKDEKWTNGLWLLKHFAHKSAPFPYGVAVEFKGILFAVSNDINAVVAYDLDGGGQLNAHWVLDELSEVFQGPPLLYPSKGLLTDLGGGCMCLLFSGLEVHQWTVRVEVFQVSITRVGDRPVVRRGSLHSYYLGSLIDYDPVIYSVFVCDHSNKSDIEADASSRSYSCEDLKKRAEHAVEYVKGDSKKQKNYIA